MTRQPNSKYWKKRSIERLAAVERGTPKYLNEIQQMYESAAREIRENIAGIIGNYAKNADLTATEAFEILRTPVTAEEIEKLKVIAKSIPDSVERVKALARLNSPAYAARISRQQAVLESTRLELAKLAPGQVQTMTTALTEAAHDSFNRTVFDIQQGFGLGYSFNQLSSGQIEEVLKQKWSGRHYSKRVWDNTEVLADRVKSVIKQNMITGRSWRRSLDEVTDIVKSGGLYSAKRLLQTETAYVANEMEAEAYEDADIEEYEFIATLDGRTSVICQEHDGKIYKLKNRKPGVNYPPLHAHCRSTTGAVVEGFDTSKLERRARDPKTGKNVLVPANMKYKDWKNQQIPKGGSLNQPLITPLSSPAIYNDTASAFKSISYKDIDTDFSNKIDMQLLDLANTYPVGFKGLTIKTSAVSGEFGHYQGQLFAKMGNPLQYVNEIVYSKANMRDEQLSAARHLNEAVRRGGKNLNISPLATIDHEFAHYLDQKAVFASNPALQAEVNSWIGVTPSKISQIQDINSLNGKIRYSTDTLSTKIAEEIKRVYNVDNIGFAKLVKDELGSYATSSYSEFFAEGFSAYRHIPVAKQTDFLKKFGQVFEIIYKGVF